MLLSLHFNPECIFICSCFCLDHFCLQPGMPFPYNFSCWSISHSLKLGSNIPFSMNATSSLQLEWITHSRFPGAFFVSMQDIHWWWWCLGNNSHYCVRVMFLGGLYRLIHSILTIPLEVDTVTASILKTEDWVGDRRAARSVIAGIRVQTGQEHSEFMSIYTTPPWSSVRSGSTWVLFWIPCNPGTGLHMWISIAKDYHMSPIHKTTWWRPWFRAA